VKGGGRGPISWVGSGPPKHVKTALLHLSPRRHLRPKRAAATKQSLHLGPFKLTQAEKKPFPLLIWKRRLVRRHTSRTHTSACSILAIVYGTPNALYVSVDLLFPVAE